MAIRKFTRDRWIRAVNAAPDEQALRRLHGDSPGSVAARFGMSRQAIHQHINAGNLDAIVVTEPDGSTWMILIPDHAIEAFEQRRAQRKRA
jgi:hypothetical protein